MLPVFLLVMIAATALTIVLMVRIHKWSRDEKMLEPLHLDPEAQ